MSFAFNKMTSDVVRWSQLFSQQNQPQQRDVMTSYEMSWLSQYNQMKKSVTNRRNTRRSSIARTIGSHLHKTVLLFVWLVINQNVSLVLSDPILAESNLTLADKTGDVLIHPPIDSLHEQNVTPNDVHPDSQYQSQYIIGDDDISNDVEFTSTWAVHIPGGDAVADSVALEHGFTNLGKVC